MNVTISDIIDQIDEIEDGLDTMNHIPEDKINSIKGALENIIQDLEDLATEYGDEDLDDEDDEF